MKYLIAIILSLSVTNLMAYGYFDMKKDALKAYKSNKVDRSYRITMKYITKHPTDLKAQNLLATLYYWDKRYSESESLLKSILSNKKKYSESKKLLTLVHKKMKKRKVAQKEVYKDLKKINSKKNDILGYLDQQSDDLESKMILAKYYFKVEKFKKAYQTAKEALDIKPDQKDMKKLISHIIKKESVQEIVKSTKNADKAKEMLASYFKEKNYLSYFNLFQTLKSSDTKFSKQEYNDALYSAVMIGQFREAKNLITKKLVPLNKKTLQVQLLLDEKLASK